MTAPVRGNPEEKEAKPVSTGTLITAILVFALAAACLTLGVLHFTERGVLLNNAWLYASKRERETMDRRPWFRRSAVVFCLLGAVFVVIGLSLVLRNDLLLLIEIPLVIGTAAYAAASTARIRKRGG